MFRTNGYYTRYTWGFLEKKKNILYITCIVKISVISSVCVLYVTEIFDDSPATIDAHRRNIILCVLSFQFSVQLTVLQLIKTFFFFFDFF